MKDKIIYAEKYITKNKFTFKNGETYTGYVLDVGKIKNSNSLQVYISPEEDPPIYYLHGIIVNSDLIVDMEEVEE